MANPDMSKFPAEPNVPDVPQIKDPFSFQKFCIRIGAIPTNYTEALTLEEQLLFFIDYLRNTVIPAVNNNADTVNALIDEFEKLYNYTHDYFDNLDVQQEVNNKLEQMVTSGELQEIITAYLQINGILGFNTVADMSNATNLIEGSFTRTYGRNELNDGYGQFYKVRTLTSSDVIDGYNIVKLNNFPTLVAQISLQIVIPNTPKVLESYYYYIDGVNGNDDNDGLTNTTAFKTIDKFFNLLNQGKTDIRGQILTTGEYHITGNINVFSNVSIHLNSELTDTNRPTIVFERSDRSIAFYASHINFQNIIIKQLNPNNASRIYFEGCTVGMTNVTANEVDRIAFQVGGIQIQNLECTRLQLYQVNGYINGLTINNTDNDRYGIQISWCSGLRLYGNLVVANLSEAGINNSSNLINCGFSDVNIMFAYTNVITNKYYYGLYAVNSVIWITKNRYNGLIKNSGFSLQNPFLSNVQIIQGNLIDTGWIPMDLTTGTPANSHYVPQYRVKNGVLFMQGGVLDVAQGDIIFTLPEEYRPANNRYTFVCAGETTDDYSLLRVSENGNVSAFRIPENFSSVQLNSIIFPLDIEN